jgi:hypothetical protein
MTWEGSVVSGTRLMCDLRGCRQSLQTKVAIVTEIGYDRSLSNHELLEILYLSVMLCILGSCDKRLKR